jgi:flagellar basal body rod protein FlgF
VLAQFTQQGPKLVGTGGVGTPTQGLSVALSGDGNTVIVGGPDAATNSTGAAWVFIRSNNAWTRQGDKLIGNGAAGPYAPAQGSSVAVSGDGNTAIVGGP